MADKNNEDIVIGVCAKNEAKNIWLCLESVEKSVRLLKKENTIVVINVNNSKDVTKNLVRNFIKERSLNNFFLVFEGKNLVEAQRYIVNHYPADIYVFIDADTKMDTKCIQELIRSLEENSNLVAVYATYRPCSEKNISWAHYVSTVYDTQNQIQTKRYYIHGRIFATRVWSIPSSQDIKERIIKYQNKFFHKLPLNCKSFIVDDIYLSFHILHNYGINSIKQINSAIASYKPTCSIKDMYRVYKRTKIELMKIKILSSEFNYLMSFIKRKTNWRNFWFHTKLMPKIAWLYFLMQRIIFKCLLSVEIFLLSENMQINKFVQWKEAISSKTKIK